MSGNLEKKINEHLKAWGWIFKIWSPPLIFTRIADKKLFEKLLEKNENVNEQCSIKECQEFLFYAIGSEDEPEMFVNQIKYWLPSLSLETTKVYVLNFPSKTIF